MKNTHRLLCLILCVPLLAGCRAAGTGQAESAPTQTETYETPSVTDGAVAFENFDKLRIVYTGVQSSVRYITSVGELPEALRDKGFDDAFFAQNALVVVTETVGSGSVQVEFDSITKQADTVTVLLSHKAPDGASVTQDMATWLLWAKVPAGLDPYDWVLGNPALPPTNVTM